MHIEVWRPVGVSGPSPKLSAVQPPVEPTPVAPPRLRHMPGLDGLRGVAVVAVVLFHGGHLAGGYLGVDLFFVLSGYLITSLLLIEGASSDTVGLVRFWGRRARRLLPALAVMLVGVAAYAAFAAEPEELHRIRWDGLATMVYAANWREIFSGSDYWALFTAPSPLAHTWSLAIEEQFYVVWPLVVLGVLAWVRRRRRRAAAASDATAPPDDRRFARTMSTLCIVLGMVSLASQAYWQGVAGWNRVYFGTDTRAFALYCGASVACFTAWRGSFASADPSARSGPRRWLLEACGLVGAVALVAAFVSMDGSSGFAHHGGLALCSLAGAAVIAAVSHPRVAILSRLLTFRPFVGLGLISYGVYLYHWPIAVWLSRERLDLSGWPLLAVQSAITLAVAIVSYRFVEQPIRHGARWPLRRVFIVPSAGFAVVGAILLVATITTLPKATDVSPEALAQAARSSHDDGTASVMIIGNSVAWYLAGDGFDAVTTRPPIEVINNGRPACQYPMTSRVVPTSGKVLTGDDIDTCNRRWADTAAAYRADYVIFVRSGVDSSRILHDGALVGPCSSAYEDYYAESLRKDIAKFTDVGATTVLVTSVPSQRHFGQTAEYYQHYLQTAACGNDVIRRVAKADPHIRLVDLETHLCTSPTNCVEEIDGAVLRKDGTHYKDQGAQIVAAWILNRIGIDASPGS